MRNTAGNPCRAYSAAAASRTPSNGAPGTSALTELARLVYPPDSRNTQPR